MNYTRDELDDMGTGEKIGTFIGNIIGVGIRATIFAFIFWWVAMFLNIIPQTVECGMCGANVYESWSVVNDNHSGFTTVCEPCYNDCKESN